MEELPQPYLEVSKKSPIMMKTKQNKKISKACHGRDKEKKLKCLHIMSPNKRSIHSCEELGLGTNKSNFLAWNCRVVRGQGIYNEAGKVQG